MDMLNLFRALWPVFLILAVVLMAIGEMRYRLIRMAKSIVDLGSSLDTVKEGIVKMSTEQALDHQKLGQVCKRLDDLVNEVKEERQSANDGVRRIWEAVEMIKTDVARLQAKGKT